MGPERRHPDARPGDAGWLSSRPRPAGHGASIPQEVQELIAESFTSNIRELEGALNRVRAYADFTGRQVDIDLAQAALGGLLPTTTTTSTPSPDEVIAGVCAFYGTSTEALASKRRDKAITKARQVAIYLLKEVSLKNLREIGALVGHRDHATVRYAWTKVSQAKETDASLKSDIESITSSLTSSN